MKAMSRWVCLILALLMIIGIFVGCGSTSSDGKDQETKQGTGDKETTPEETETEESYLDNLPKTMDFNETEIRFLPVTTSHGNSVSMGDEATGDNVQAAIMDRNGALSERLNIIIELLPEAGYHEMPATVALAVSSGSDDYDVVIGYCSYDIGMAQNGYMINLSNLNYLDFSQSYWGSEYMKAMSYKGINFWATGDISLTYTSFSYAFLVNSKLWNDFYSDQNIYQIVRDKEWTIELLGDFAAGVTTDLNGDGTKDRDDLWGFAMQDGHFIMAMATACGVQYSQVNEDGDIEITLDSPETEDIYYVLHELFFDRENVTLMLPLNEYDDVSKDMFAQDRLMFWNMNMRDLQKEEIRSMTSDYMVIPMPMMDDVQDDYYNMLQDGVGIYGIPTTASHAKYDAIAATLEAMASMSAQSVLPAYYDYSLKFKYSRDEESGKMIDIIHDTIHADFAFIWGDNIGDITWFMYRNMNKSSKSLASAFKSNRSVWETELEALTEALDRFVDNGA